MHPVEKLLEDVSNMEHEVVKIFKLASKLKKRVRRTKRQIKCHLEKATSTNGSTVAEAPSCVNHQMVGTGVKPEPLLVAASADSIEKEERHVDDNNGGDDTRDDARGESPSAEEIKRLNSSRAYSNRFSLVHLYAPVPIALRIGGILSKPMTSFRIETIQAIQCTECRKTVSPAKIMCRRDGTIRQINI